jgi:hypothetical protein
MVAPQAGFRQEAGDPVYIAVLADSSRVFREFSAYCRVPMGANRRRK